MSHYAKVVDGKVTQVIVAEADFFKSFVDSSPGAWIQTSYNTRGGVHYGQDGKPDGGVALRANYAGIGYIYDSVNDVFYTPRPKDATGTPCNSWNIDAANNWIWSPPTPRPTPEANTFSLWYEANTSWVSVSM
jgi:hypothetical protein